jgi:hypothetical protein
VPKPSALPGEFNTEMGFDEWVKFIFDHPVDTDIASSWDKSDQLIELWDDWFFGEKTNPELQLQHAIKLFQDSAFLLTAYTPEQINQGLWFLLGRRSGFCLQDLLWNTELSWPLREQCVLAMVKTFQAIFTQIPEQGVCYMWWDILRYFGEDADLRVKEAMLQAMSSILEMPLLEFQVSALHGLGHLEHSGKKTVIENYLAKSPNVEVKIWPEMDITVRQYALAAIASNVL